VLRMDQPQVFYTYEWALAVCRAYREVLPPNIFLAYDSTDKLCGVAALAVANRSRRASFLCSTTADYCDFISDPQDRRALVHAVIAELHGMRIRDINFANLPADSVTVAALEDMQVSQKYHRFSRTGYICTQVDLKSLERYPDGTVVLPRRKMVRRSLNVFSRENPVWLDHSASSEALDVVLPKFMQAHVARFLYTGRISNIARNERRVFLTELANLLAEQGWIALSRLMSGDRPLAWNYGFHFHGSWFWYQPTFDNDLEKHSPGFCLLAKLIEHAATDPSTQVVDLGLGSEEYKDQFANSTREILYTTLRRSLVKHWREIARYRAAEWIQRRPALEDKARGLVGAARRLGDRFQTQGLLSTIRSLGSRVWDLVWSRSEVALYQWSAPQESYPAELQSLHWDQLATAAMQYSDDPATLDYLLRSAARLRRGKEKGYALVDKSGSVLHIAWVGDFQDFFLAELNSSIEAPNANCSMIFDCWTPVAMRGQGYYARTIAEIARGLQEHGKQAWIFSATTNVASTRGVEEAGFRRMYSLVRTRLLGRQWIRRQNSDLEFSEPQVRISSQDPAA